MGAGFPVFITASPPYRESPCEPTLVPQGMLLEFTLSARLSALLFPREDILRALVYSTDGNLSYGKRFTDQHSILKKEVDRILAAQKA
jgi:hypothetical protein